MSIWTLLASRLSPPSRRMAALRPLISITGTTGTGKSQLAVQIARRFDGEIINADALQLYQGLPIATNKISTTEMQGVNHHLLGSVNLHEEPWTIGRFVSEAQIIVSAIQARGKLPIVVGGTHYYVQALLLENNILSDTNQGADDGTHEHSWPILSASTETMIEKLRELDPEAADWWHPRDSRKIRRSLEICLNTGRKVSDLYREQQAAETAQGPAYRQRYDSLCLHLHADREALVQRLGERVDSMMQRGLLDEVCFMRAEKVRLGRAGTQADESSGIWTAIGFKEFAQYFEALESNANTVVVEELRRHGLERTKISTRQYAARQHKWVKNKLVPAITVAGFHNRFFVLDATCPAKWDESVKVPALSVVAKFLEQTALPHPTTLSTSAALFDQNNKAVRIKHTCDICQVTTVTAESWDEHLKSSRHKRSAHPRTSHDCRRGLAKT